MAKILLALFILMLAACSHSQPMPHPVVDAAKNTLTWDRSWQAHDYRVYACWMAGCETGTVWTMLKVVPQPPPGTKPTYWRELTGSVGAYAVRARDTEWNESPFSVPLPFDRR